MDAVSLALAKNYTNEKLNSLPSNAPTKTVSFDGGIYSVGNNVVNGQVSAILKGNTWTNRAGIGDTSPQTIENLDSAKTYLLIKTDGGTVNVDAVDTAVPAKITGKTSTVLTWASGKIALYELSTAEAALTEAQLGARYHYVSGTKSTNSVRIRSVNEDETKESIAYVNLPQIEELRSLPNGTKEEVRVSSGKAEWIKKVNSIVIKDSDFSSNMVTSPTNVDILVTNRNFLPDAITFDTTSSMLGVITIEGRKQITAVGRDNIDNIGSFYVFEDQRIGFVVAKGTSLEQAKSLWTGLTPTYQLATPIVTKLPAQAPLQVYENGTVYVEPLGDPSETTLPSVEMTIPTGSSNKFGVATHDYDGDAADWALTNNESKCFLLAVSNAGGAANIIAPDAPGVMYAISNASEYTITIKISGGNGVEITNAKTVLVIHNGTDYTALTAELSAEL